MGAVGAHNDIGDPAGAVMVVGGGIAGMQASLDLAEQGFQVYLVESGSAIGGHMAQLDKTFPTNDCAMCTISPKLVEVVRHPDIRMLTGTEVLDLQGKAGDFTVTLRCQPRYVDPAKCVSCGDCTQVCPVIVPDRFNEGLSLRRAIYKLYPQAAPNAFAIEKRGIAPCRDACPAGQRAQGYIALIREGRWQDALRVIKMDNPFPGICGRVCNHLCETACNRGQVDEPINIRALKRFVTDKVYAEPRQPLEPAACLYEQRIAIIGAGPCGLTAAQDLVREGYPVTVFEAMPVAGGMLRLGVPEYRLPAEIIEREVQDILDLGVDLRLNHTIHDLDEVFAWGYEAVLIAVGAHEGIRLPIPGADLPGVLINTHFLRDVRLGRLAAGAETLSESGQDGKPPQLGKRVLVLGGGNVAVDCARTAVRLGCQVSMAFLEPRDKMTSHPWEVQSAEAEGVGMYASRSFERILADENGHVRGVECQQVASFSFDERGRLNLEKTPGSLHTIECDTVIFSVGQRAGLAFIPGDANVGLTDRQTIAINPNTLATSRPGVFAAGDCISGTAQVIEAVDRGHTAARSITRYLRGEAMELPLKPELPVVHLSGAEIAERLARGEIHRQARVPMPELSVEARRDNFAEVEGGYDDQSAQSEAARCLACGICSECMSCVFACGAQAIDHDMAGSTETLRVGAAILAPGFQPYPAELSEEYGYGRYPNVITALQFERLLSASGPTLGELRRPSDGAHPQRIAFLQCVGSRDQQHDYCSAVCCMAATKEAIIAKEHHPELDIHIFYMDMRAFSKGYSSYYERARQQYGIHYNRCRVSALREDPATHSLLIRSATAAAAATAAAPVGGQETERLAGWEIQEQCFDLVVLSVGMQIPEETRRLATRLGVAVDVHGFCQAGSLPNPLETSRAGVYAVGPFREPKDIPESVVEASAAAASIAARLSRARFTRTSSREYPPERDVRAEPARVGVFICHCGSNIAGYLDVASVTDYAARLPSVTHAEANLYTCSQDSIRHISAVVQEQNLNRVVVASCTPLTHAPLFQDSLRAAGLNPFLFEMANIRNQCSWVHSHDRPAATAKATDLVRMAVARAVLLTPQPTFDVPVQHSALVVGGGPAGLAAALTLAEQGFPVHLVEKEPVLGGNLRRLHSPLVGLGAGDGSSMPAGLLPQEILHTLLAQVEASKNITLHMSSQVVAASGFKGNFGITIQDAAGLRQQVPVGAVILAAGAQEYRGPEYGYGQSPRVLTQMEFEERLSAGQAAGLAVGAVPGSRDGLPASVVMIQCVGPGAKTCTRVCCTTALKNALVYKERRPDGQVVILYQDIRVYGFKERLYNEARRRGVLFVRYSEEQPPQVAFSADAQPGEPPGLRIRTWEPALGRALELRPEMLVLSMPVVPADSLRPLAALFKVSLDADGFFLEAHIKLRPVDFATDGIFLAGMAHYPRLLDESVIQGQAAAARAARLLSQESMPAGGRVAVVESERCTGCLTCVRICPFNVPRIKPEQQGVGGILGAAWIEPAVCQGCGQCAAECPARAIQLMHYTDAQMVAKVQALLRPEVAFIPVEELVYAG